MMFSLSLIVYFIFLLLISLEKNHGLSLTSQTVCFRLVKINVDIVQIKHVLKGQADSIKMVFVTGFAGFAYAVSIDTLNVIAFAVNEKGKVPLHSLRRFLQRNRSLQTKNITMILFCSLNSNLVKYAMKNI